MRAAGRPVFLNLLQIRLPLTGVSSILHRIAGIVLFLSLVPALYLLQQSLQGPAAWTETVALLHRGWMQPLLLVLFWAFWHHFLNGLRLLLMDLGSGFGRERSTHLSAGVLILAPLLALACMGVW